ncbi:MAG: hypothetical protein VW268_01800 [Rhodospirillaceae bacterium]
MTDVTKVGGPNPQPVSRPASPSKSATTDNADKSGDAKAASAAFRLPETLASGHTGPASAADALRTVLQSLNAHFAGLDSNPPANGGALEDLLSEIKVAAPVLDHILAARRGELEGDADGLKALDDQLGRAEGSIADARDRLEVLAGDLADGGAIDDPDVANALTAVLGAGRDIPQFSAEELRKGRVEFIALVFDDIADAVGRHRGQGASGPSFTLASLGGAAQSA